MCFWQQGSFHFRCRPKQVWTSVLAVLVAQIFAHVSQYICCFKEQVHATFAATCSTSHISLIFARDIVASWLHVGEAPPTSFPRPELELLLVSAVRFRRVSLLQILCTFSGMIQ